MKRSRFFITAILLVSLATLPSFAGTAKPGWTKVQLTYAQGNSGPFPPELLATHGGELLVDYGSQAIGYVPAAALLALQAEAQTLNITVAQRDDFDILHFPSGVQVDARYGIIEEVPEEQLIGLYPATAPGLFVIQFIAPPRPEWITELVSMGWELDRYIPSNGYIATGVPELVSPTWELPYIQFVDYFHPFEKAKQLEGDGVARDLVFELASRRDPSSAVDAISAVADSGVDLTGESTDTLAYANVTDADAELLLLDPLVISVSPRPIGALSDERQNMSLTSYINSAGSAPTNPAGYTSWLTARCPTCATMSAATWRVGVADTGLDDGTNGGGHADLAGRKFFGARVYSVPDDTCTVLGNLNCDKYGHGTIVSGIIAGNATTATKDPLGFYWSMGVAPWAGIFSTKVLTGNPTVDVDFAQLFKITGDAAENNVTIQNHSFNEYRAKPDQSGLYSALARQYDIAVRDADGSRSEARTPLLISVSAGNNNQTVTLNKYRVLGGATAKNVLSMGGSENYRPDLVQCNAPGTDFRNISRSSRTGTLLLGYIKPDLVAPAGPTSSTATSEGGGAGYCMSNLAEFDPDGDGILDTRYNGDTGTSFAAPVGAASALIVKRYVGPTPAATSPALAKAMLVAGAKSLRGGLDLSPAGPDIAIQAFPNGQQGFGRISFDDIITGSTPPVWYDQAAALSFNSITGPFRIRLQVRDASKPVKVALVWTDAPGTAYASNPLVNDLDLEVYRASDISHRYVGNYLAVPDTNKGEESIAVPLSDGNAGRDRINNVEVVRAFMNSSEQFEVQVIGNSILGDTDGNTSTFEQDFALVALNADLVNSGNPTAPVLTASRHSTDPQRAVLVWTPSVNVMNVHYEVWRGTNFGNMTKIVPSTTALGFDEAGLPINTTFIYRVVAVGNGGASAASNNSTATTISWAPDTSLPAGSVFAKTQHWLDLRRGADYVRTAAGLSTNTWALPIANNGFIRASQLTELRTKLLEAFTALSVPAPAFTTPTPTVGVTLIRPQDVLDLRSAIE